MKKKFEIIEIKEENASDTGTEINKTVKLTKEFLTGIQNYWHTLVEKIYHITPNYKREVAAIIEEKTDKLYLKSCIVQYETPLDRPAKYLNSLFLWEAYRFSREKNFNIPDQFLEYLDRCADSVLKIISKKNDKAVRQLDDAFEFLDRHFSKYQGDKKKLKAYILVKKMKEEDQSRNMQEIFSLMAKELNPKEDDPDYDGAGTISKWYYDIEKRMDFPMILRQIKISNKKS